LYNNDGQGEFQLDANSAVSKHVVSTGASLGDYDNDGDLDLFLNGRSDNSNIGRALFRNDLDNANHWVSFKLSGTSSNRAAIGAKIRVKISENSTSKWLRRDVSAQNTFQGQNDLRVHFGLGNVAVIDELEITWPSGNVTTCSGLASNQFYEITEKNGVWDNCLANNTQDAKGLEIQVYPVPANGHLSINLPDKQPCTDCKIVISDGSGRKTLELGFVTEISVETLPAGLYLVQILKNGKTVGKQKFIKYK
jgi:enediyne biosynthesis protein E4